ncbi:MAG: ATP-dependent sacrificial sulfur transferase LarE [Eubacteriales bacterium]|nr:ATP-dependent sacrificial sulfur transferase LarE [Eubacteriales bacterium]
MTCLSEYATSDVVLAFSGGVDSNILLKMCVEAAKPFGSKVYGVTVHTKLHPSGDLAIAKRVCEETGAIHKVIYADELMEAGIQDNPINRCYLCKKCIFVKIKEMAEELGVTKILEGTNEDDLHVYRPGIQALKELKIISPLADCMITKREVRELAREYGISVADRPSTPCMATRFPYGATLDYDQLKKVEEGENWFRAQGYYNVRLRVHGEILRIEVDEEDFVKIMLGRKEIIAKMKSLGYPYVTLDLEGFRSGSMDIHKIKK